MQETAQLLTVSAPLPPPTSPSLGAIPRLNEANALADASYSMYQTERHDAPESRVDWQAALAAGDHIARGSEVLRDRHEPGSLAPWRPLVSDSATKVGDACGDLAHALYEGRDPSVGRVAVASAPDYRVADMQTWLAGVADDLTRLSVHSSKGNRNASGDASVSRALPP